MASPACIVVLCFALATVTFGAPNVDFANFEIAALKTGLENEPGHKVAKSPVEDSGHQSHVPSGDQNPTHGSQSQGNTDPDQGNSAQGNQGSGSQGQGNQGSGSQGQGNPGSGSQGQGNQGSGSQGQGNQGSGSQGQGNQGSGSQGQGNQGSGSQGQGNQGSGSQGQGNQGSGSQGQGNQGSGSQGQGNQGSGSQGQGNQGSGSQGQGNQGSGSQGQGNQGSGSQGQGNQGSGNQGQGNPGQGNQGQGNQGQGNQGQGNQGSGNQGQGNQGSGSQGQGNQGQGNQGQGNQGSGSQGQGNQGQGNQGQGNQGSGGQGQGNQGQGNQGQGNQGQGNQGNGNQGNGNQGNGNQGNGNQGNGNQPQPPQPHLVVYEFGTKSRYDEVMADTLPFKPSDSPSTTAKDFKTNVKYTDPKNKKITYVRIEVLQTGDGSANIVEGGIGTSSVNIAIVAKGSYSYQHRAVFYNSPLEYNMVALGNSTAKDVVLARVKGAEQYSVNTKAVKVIKYPGTSEKLKDKKPTYVVVNSKQTSTKLAAAVTKGDLKKSKDPLEVTLTAEDTKEFDYEVVFYSSAARSQPFFFTAAVSMLVYLWSRVA